MSIDEAIKHAEEVAQEKRYEYQECLAIHDMENARDCGKCGEEHRQLAEWLKDLKQTRQAIEDIKAEIEEKRNEAIEEKRYCSHENREYYEGKIMGFDMVMTKLTSISEKENENDRTRIN